MIETAHNALVALMRRNSKIPVIVGEVVAVNADFTCDIQPANGGSVYHDVRLKTSVDNDEAGIVLVPPAGASVILIMIGEDENNFYVVSSSKVDRYLIKSESGITLEFTPSGELHINGSSFGGLLKHDDVKQALDGLQQSVNTLTNSARAGFAALSLIDGSASLNAFNVTATIIPINTSDLQNLNVKHG